MKRRTWLPLAIVWCGLGGVAQSAHGQQADPLLFLKGPKPRVIIALDLSSRMQRDESEHYYDPHVYSVRGLAFETALGIGPGVADRHYRRRYRDLRWMPTGETPRAVAAAIEVVGDREPEFAPFDALTRLGRVRAALARAIARNVDSVQFGLVCSRQATAAVPLPEAVLALDGPTPGGQTDSDVEGLWRASFPIVADAGRSPAATSRIIAADLGASNLQLQALLRLTPGRDGALIPAGHDEGSAEDRPLERLLEDTHAEAARIVATDTACRHTVVVLVTAGAESPRTEEGLADLAARFRAVHGRAVPLHVIAVAPDSLSSGRLREVAARGGGRFVEITPGQLREAGADGVVGAFVAALNYSVQHAFADPTDPPTPTGDLPLSEFSTRPPVVGTVNLENARDAAGALLQGTRVTGPDGQVLPQASNVLITAALGLPGFEGVLKAFRVYKPVTDASRPSGYRFVADGSVLWRARTPPPERRNLFTVLPGRGVVRLSLSNAAVLAPYFQGRSPETVIQAALDRPLGAIVNSTPALLTPPALALADPDYVEFFERHRQRRSLLFVGGADAMLHAFDARTGIEVWAVVPFNLLPRLPHLLEGHGIDDPVWGVESSPRLADVRTAAGWRTLLMVGEGPGGTFYQAFDVSLDAIAASVPPNDDDLDALLGWFGSAERIRFLWSFPRYEQFDPSIPPYGDLAPTATQDEKTVGQTWATPAVGIVDQSSRSVAIVGSGFLPAGTEQQANRGGVVAGTRIYMLDAASGVLLDSRDVGSDGLGETTNGCRDDCRYLKNAVQADPMMSGRRGAAGVDRAYVGDLDGRVWRLSFDAVSEVPAFRGDPVRLHDGGASNPIFGAMALVASGPAGVTLAFGTGSDLLPGTSGGGRLMALEENSGRPSLRFEIPLPNDVATGPERVSGSAAVAGDVLFFTTSARSSSSRCGGVTLSVYGLTVGGGAAYAGGSSDREPAGPSPPRALLRVTGRQPTAPVAADRHLFVSQGTKRHVFGDPEGYNAGPGYLGLRVLSIRPLR